MRLIKIFIILLVLNWTASCFAATPKVLFSDIEDGAITGFDASHGYPVSIYCRNIGSTRGSSYVTVGGVALTNDSDYAEWGATTNPRTPTGIQRITFFLNSSMATGGNYPNTTIKVTTSEGTSATIPFHTRVIGSNHIYYLSPSGDDTSGDGSISNPWKTGVAVRTHMTAGDIFLLRSGVYLDVDPLWDESRATWIQVYNDNLVHGSAGLSCIVKSYPGELAQIGDGSIYNSSVGNIVPLLMFDRITGNNINIVDYWTISNIKILTGTGVLNEGNSGPNFEDNHFRFVGMDVRTTRTAPGTGIPWTKEGGGGGSHHSYILGCYVHQTGVPLPPVNPPTAVVGSSGNLTGSYTVKYTWVETAGDDIQTLQESEMSPASSEITVSAQNINITWGDPPSDHTPQFNNVRIYRTKANAPGVWYLEAQVPVADKAYTLSKDDNELGINQIDSGYRVGAIYYGGYGYLDYVHFEYNEVANCNAGIQNYGHVSTDYIDNVHFANNIFHHVAMSKDHTRPVIISGGGDGDSNYTYVRTVNIYNNVFHDNWGPAIRVDGYTTGGGGNFNIYNNTVYAFGIGDMDYYEIGGVELGSVNFSNNISFISGPSIYNTCWYGYNSTCNNVSGSNNIWYGVSASEVPAWDMSPITLDPLFIDSANNDLHLQSTSPARDAGATIPLVDHDFDGLVRPQGAVYDIGAYEYADGSSPTCDSSHLNICTDQSSCQAAGGNWCAGVCQSEPCATAFNCGAVPIMQVH